MLGSSEYQFADLSFTMILYQSLLLEALQLSMVLNASLSLSKLVFLEGRK